MELLEIIADVLDVDTDALSEEAGPATMGGDWTSLKHVQLVVTLEEVYGVSFSRDEIKSLGSVERIRTVLAGKGAAVADAATENEAAKA